MDKSKFKNSNGVLITRGLFFETADDTVTAVYTLKKEDHRGYPSLYRLYINTLDPSEYTFANTHLYDWEHFERLTSAEWFDSYISLWRRELSAKLRSQAEAKLIGLMTNGEGPTALAAAKYLLERTEKAAGRRSVGRPVGSGPNQKMNQGASLPDYGASRIEKDFERLVN